MPGRCAIRIRQCVLLARECRVLSRRLAAESGPPVARHRQVHAPCEAEAGNGHRCRSTQQADRCGVRGHQGACREWIGNASISTGPQCTPAMATIHQNVIVVTITILVSLLAMAGLNRVWPREQRRQYNDLIGWQLSILGTTYAVILGFMLYTVWTSFGEAERNVDIEANAVVNLYRLADGLPESQRTQLQTLARSYAETAIQQDWPEMARGEVPEQ